MDVPAIMDSLRASARNGQTFSQWLVLTDPGEYQQVYAYHKAYTPFERYNTWGSMPTRQVISATIPESNNRTVSEASCNALGAAILDEISVRWTGKRTGITDKEFRLPFLLDMWAVELIILDSVNNLTQSGQRGTHLRKREVEWLHALFNRPSYVRPERTGISGILGTKEGLSIPVVALANDTTRNLLIEVGLATGDVAALQPQSPPDAVNFYGSPAESGSLHYSDLNITRAYLRLPRLDSSTIALANGATHAYDPSTLGIAQWQGNPYLYMWVETEVAQSGNPRTPVRYVLVEPTAAQLEETRKRHHHLHPSELRQDPVIGWFEWP